MKYIIASVVFFIIAIQIVRCENESQAYIKEGYSQAVSNNKIIWVKETAWVENGELVGYVGHNGLMICSNCSTVTENQ